MAGPSVSDVHVNTPLTQISIAYLQNQQNFVASRVFPVIPVSKQSDRYYTYDRGDFNRDEMQLRAPSTESAGTGYRIDNTPTYYTPIYALHKDIPDEVRANSDAVLNPDRETTELLTLKSLLKKEKLWASTYFTNGVWTTDLTGVSGTPTTNQVKQWNDSASTPVQDVRAAATAILQRTGFKPNKLVIGKAVYDALADNVSIMDRIKYGAAPNQPAMVTLQAMAALFEVDSIEVMSAIENTAAEGAANVHSFIGGKKALLVYAPPSPGLMTPSAGYTFAWSGMFGGDAAGIRIRTFRMENLKSDRIECEYSFDQKLIAADLGAFWTTVVA
ncbi:major capsid protein [Candidatus Contendibacter odensensis]|uniref:Capsid related protein n=1 Tax=Candidatus Contendobacter odensis Run_B_J11 TaxID=1400861 RepID=A0A7U7J274_9GAMM|nr:major capsid protein [Candidatus Contendobacter odensis]CDH43840.1 Capsid related protein [Candidatus Contendobacter odensis Run_B_J11]